jgi:hypothetical protein
MLQEQQDDEFISTIQIAYTLQRQSVYVTLLEHFRASLCLLFVLLADISILVICSILSHGTYCLFWGSDSQGIKVFKLQKKVVRLICNVRKRTSYRELRI